MDTNQKERELKEMKETKEILQHLEQIASWVNGVNEGSDIIACPGYDSGVCQLFEDRHTVGPCSWMGRVETEEYQGRSGLAYRAVMWEIGDKEVSHYFIYFILTSAHRRFAPKEVFHWQEVSRETYSSTDWLESRCTEADCPKCAHPSEPGVAYGR